MSSRNTNYICNIRSHKFDTSGEIQSQVINYLDAFFHPLLLRKGIKVVIIVGRGLNSRRVINGLHPLKYYTIEYLNSVKLNWRVAGIADGGEGAMVVEL